MAQAIVLAAGLSSRAKRNKLALSLGHRSILQILVTTLQQTCREIIVVTGHYREDVEQLLEGYDHVTFVHNEDYEKGMFSSVLTGVAQVKEDFVITPGDCPSIQEATIKALLASEGLLRVPLVGKRRGHPLFVSFELVDKLLQEPVESNLKVFRDRYPITEVLVKDTGSLVDIDTYEQYQQLKRMWKGE